MRGVYKSMKPDYTNRIPSNLKLFIRVFGNINYLNCFDNDLSCRLILFKKKKGIFVYVSVSRSNKIKCESDAVKKPVVCLKEDGN